jgi:hypothetical protein
MGKLIAIGSLLALFGCATASRQNIALTGKGDAAHPFVVGHSQDGEIVLASTHADAMNGLAVAVADVGASKNSLGEEELICHKETPTGTHVPTWVCRYPSEVERQRMQTHQFLVQPRVCIDCRAQ